VSLNHDSVLDLTGRAPALHRVRGIASLMVLIGTCLGHSDAPSLLFCVALIGASLLVAVLSYELFEKQILKLKQSFVARPKTCDAPAFAESAAV
jgi:peptidoglycan/LPS O-acetylase OafA/YrhL